MLVVPDYKAHRIEVVAVHVDGAWNAEVRVRRTFTEEKPHVEVVTCRKPTAQVAEERAAIYARRLIDRTRLEARPRGPPADISHRHPTPRCGKNFSRVGTDESSGYDRRESRYFYAPP